MRFWDASALVPLFLIEQSTPAMLQLRQDDADIIAWWGSRVECSSVIARLVREGRLGEAPASQAHVDLMALWEAVAEISPVEEVRSRAEACLQAHPLRAADSLQLGASLIWSADQPGGRVFVSLDLRLREAARNEGFVVLPDTMPSQAT